MRLPPATLLVVLCATREQAEQARELVAAVLDMLGLRLHPEKTGIAHLARGAEGFTFLGFEHRMRESWRQPGRWYLQKWPSRRAMASIRGKIRLLVVARSVLLGRGLTLACGGLVVIAGAPGDRTAR